jgi:hypothetical protein
MLWDYHFSESEIKSIIDLAVSRGYVIGSGWSRSAGRMTVLKWRNDKFPDKQVLMFTI